MLWPRQQVFRNGMYSFKMTSRQAWETQIQGSETLSPETVNDTQYPAEKAENIAKVLTRRALRG